MRNAWLLCLAAMVASVGAFSQALAAEKTEGGGAPEKAQAPAEPAAPAPAETPAAVPAPGEEVHADVVGSVKIVKGGVTIVRGDKEEAAALGARLYAGDVLRTGADGAVGVILRDDTTLSLGPSSELAMKEFVFKPSEGLFSMVIDMVKGTFVYVSGRLGKLAPESVKVETPVGIVAIRGTKFMAKIGG